MRYTFCPRRTPACGTPGPILRPLLNLNQTVTISNTINATISDVCYWQLIVNIANFNNTHPNVKTSDAFINLVITSRTNLITYTLQGNDTRYNAFNLTQNATVNQAYKYPLSNGSSVYLIAFQNFSTYQTSSLSFTFNITADYYPSGGMAAQLSTSLVIQDVSRVGFWTFIEFGFGFGLCILIAILFRICCKDFDPESDFERRRRKLKREKKVKDKEAKKTKEKEEKMKKKPVKEEKTPKKKGKKDVEEEDESDESPDAKKKQAKGKKEDLKKPKIEPKKNKKGKKDSDEHDSEEEESPQDKRKKAKPEKKPVKKSLETEIKLKNEKNNK